MSLPPLFDVVSMKFLTYFTALLVTCALAAPQSSRAEDQYDIVIYGGTSAGVVAAVQAARMGHSAIVIEPSAHLGGLTSGGLGATDIGNKAAIGGISREFYKRLGKHYDADEMWTFEPHVAENLYKEMIAEAKIPVVFNERLDLQNGVVKKAGRIESITVESGRKFQGKIFIDATYEGDLMAKAGVSYHVGREANATYGETLNGVATKYDKYHQFDVSVDPYVVPGDPASGLLPGIHDEGPGEEGSGDHRIQGYCFRMCLTDRKDNQLPFPKPKGYDPLRYELLLRTLKQGQWEVLRLSTRMPSGKTDTNNKGPFATDNIGMNYEYPEGDYQTRDEIIADHVTYQQGLMWFLANDSRVPKNVQEEVNRWGLAADEFKDNGGWPHQLYVREARRMISEYVMTQQDCQGERIAEDAVGLAAYTMDSHHVQRYVDKNGHARNEGDVQVGGFSPYPISYRSIRPREDECQNLLVPVCVSSSHIAFGSIRMEPVFMVLAQSAATAAVMAIENGTSVQQVDIKQLQDRLTKEGQVLEWTGPVRNIISAAKLPGIVVDNTQAELKGFATTGYVIPPFVGQNYAHDSNEKKGEQSARFTFQVKEAGTYEVRVSYSPGPNRATNIPVVIHHATGVAMVKLNQREPAKIEGLFQPLGTFKYQPNQDYSVQILNTSTDGHVMVDAIQVIAVDMK